MTKPKLDEVTVKDVITLKDVKAGDLFVTKEGKGWIYLKTKYSIVGFKIEKKERFDLLNETIRATFDCKTTNAKLLSSEEYEKFKDNEA